MTSTTLKASKSYRVERMEMVSEFTSKPSRANNVQACIDFDIYYNEGGMAAMDEREDFMVQPVDVDNAMPDYF